MLSLPEQPARTSICDIVVVGGSAGGIQALISLLNALPADFPLPILVVQHLSRETPSRLPEILQWRTKWVAKWAEDGEPIRRGVVYVGPADRHLLLGPDRRLALSSTPPFRWWRPAVDALFQSAAEIYGERVVAVVLSGAMWDGARGISAIASRGGITIVQDEATSEHFDMPASAIDLGRADLVMSPIKIAAALQTLAEPSFLSTCPVLASSQFTADLTDRLATPELLLEGRVRKPASQAWDDPGKPVQPR